MNVIKWIRGWFRKPEPEEKVSYGGINRDASAYWKTRTFGLAGHLEDAFREARLEKLNRDIDDCKKRLEAAVKAKKGGVPALRKELQEKKAQVFREEGNVG